MLTQPRVSRKSVDIVLKYVAEALGGALFERFGRVRATFPRNG